MNISILLQPGPLQVALETQLEQALISDADEQTTCLIIAIVFRLLFHFS